MNKAPITVRVYPKDHKKLRLMAFKANKSIATIIEQLLNKKTVCK